MWSITIGKRAGGAAVLAVTAASGFFAGSNAFQVQAQSHASEAFRVPRGLVIQVETYNVRDGRKVPSTESIIAIREDGATAEWNKYARMAEVGYFQRILDFPATGERIAIDLLGGSKTTTREAPARVNARAEYIANGKYGNCMGNLNPRSQITRTLEGTEEIHGIRTVRIKQVFGNTGETELSWVAPDYNCLLIQQVVNRGASEYRRQVKSARFGDPDASLFDVPDGLQEASPSAAGIRASEKVYGALAKAPE